MRNLLDKKNLIVTACGLAVTGIVLAVMNKSKEEEEQVNPNYESFDVSNEPVTE